MKRFLRALATLWPNVETLHATSLRNRLKHRIPIALLIICMCAVHQASAQEAEPAATASTAITPLQIGDPIPDDLWNMPLQVVNHPPTGGKETITLADYKGKLIILDFWVIASIG